MAIASKLFSFIQKDYDSLNVYSEKFDKAFTALIKSNPATMDHSFKKMIDSNVCLIKTSSDGRFRVYSWDTWTGGTMHIFKTIFQWRDNGKVFTKIPYDPKDDAGSFGANLFTVNIKDKNYYLLVTNAIFSTKDAMQSIAVYTINNNKLVDTARLFKTKTKRLNRIDVSFDFFSVIDRPERPLALITYDEKLKIIYIPVVDDKEQVTNKNILYQLKDQYFEFIGVETGKRK